MKKLVHVLLLLIVSIVFCNVARSAKYYVNNNSLANDVYCTAVGNNGNNGTSPSTPKANISNILSTYAASFTSSDTIFIDAGTYNDNNMSSPINGVVIKGAGNTLTIYDNSCADCYFMYINDNNTQLIGMKLFDYNNQTGPDGQVLGITSSTTGVKITDVVVTGSSTSSSAAEFPIVVWSGAQVTFTGGGTTCNSWDGGGGIYVTGATTNVVINNYLFVGNYQLWAAPSCSGLWVANGTVTVNNSRFESNEVDGSTFVGSAIYVTGGNVKINDCVFDGNRSWLSNNSTGGTIFVSGGTFRIARSIISNHTQTNGAYTSYGAGIGVTGGTVVIDSCRFFGNSGSTTRGTDLYNNGGAITVRYSTFSSSNNKVGSTAGTISFSFSGNPSYSASYNTGISFVNTTASPYIPNTQTAMYTGTCASSITILPVELISFSAGCEDTYADLHWSTASEHNNSFFTVEHAGENGQFTLLGTIEGQLNKTTRTDYNFTDFYSERGMNYYRLSQTDTDGRSKLLGTISLYNDCLQENANMNCVYNANENTMVIGYYLNESEFLKIEVFNSMGQLLTESEELFHSSDRTFKLNLKEHLSSGLYFVYLSNAKTKLSDKVLVINNN